jgi:hypothetical protein
MAQWQATVVRLLEDSVPKKTFMFTKAEDAQLTELARFLVLTQTDAVRWAIRHTLETLRRGERVYVPEPPEGPGTPTSAPSVARRRPLRVVGKTRASKPARSGR